MTAPPTFRRARSDEQRAERREAILATAAAMLEGHRVADLSLNELSRRVGLAKSNVLHYFESREAILLELHDREFRAWLDELEIRLAAVVGGSASTPVDQVAAAIADTAAQHPVFCELTAAVAGVLEHNVSADVAADYKRSAIANFGRLAEIVATRIGVFPDPARYLFVGAVMLLIGGVWAASQPSPGVAAAYDAYPDLRSMRVDLRLALRELVATILMGLQHRTPSI